MKITYQLETEDYIHFNLFQIHHSEKLSKRLAIQRIIVVVLFALLALLAYFFLNYFTLIVVGLLLLISIFWYLYFPTFSKNQVIRATERTVARGDLSGLFDEIELEINAEGVREKVQSNEHLAQWTTIQSVNFTTEAIYFFISQTNAIIIPKRTLTQEKNKELKALINRYYPGQINNYQQ